MYVPFAIYGVFRGRMPMILFKFILSSINLQIARARKPFQLLTKELDPNKITEGHIKKLRLKKNVGGVFLLNNL